MLSGRIGAGVSSGWSAPGRRNRYPRRPVYALGENPSSERQNGRLRTIVIWNGDSLGNLHVCPPRPRGCSRSSSRCASVAPAVTRAGLAPGLTATAVSDRISFFVRARRRSSSALSNSFEAGKSASARLRFRVNTVSPPIEVESWQLGVQMMSSRRSGRGVV
jgi:hypothetical protein